MVPPCLLSKHLSSGTGTTFRYPSLVTVALRRGLLHFDLLLPGVFLLHRLSARTNRRLSVKPLKRTSPAHGISFVSIMLIITDYFTLSIPLAKKILLHSTANRLRAAVCPCIADKGGRYSSPPTLSSLRLLRVTIRVAPISARMASQRVSQPGNTASTAMALTAREKVMFCLMMVRA